MRCDDVTTDKKRTKHSNMGIFWLELILATFIPFIVCWCSIPTNILNSNALFGLLELIGLGGGALILFSGIPIGILGIWKAREMEKRRVATIVLSILNILSGITEIAVLIFVLGAVVFGGASH